MRERRRRALREVVIGVLGARGFVAAVQTATCTHLGGAGTTTLLCAGA